MRKQKDIDNAFTTCCIIHNILLESDGWSKQGQGSLNTGIHRQQSKGDALTFRVEDTTEDEVMDAEERRQCPIESKRLALQWQCQMQKLVDNYKFYAMN
jgi:hypothetical protein